MKRSKSQLDINKKFAREGPTVRIQREALNNSYDLFDYMMEYLMIEGYADTNENALVIMANMSEDWKQSIVEAGRLHTSSDQQVGFARINDQESGGRGKKPMSDAEIKKQKGGKEFLDRIAATKKDPKYKG